MSREDSLLEGLIEDGRPLLMPTAVTGVTRPARRLAGVTPDQWFLVGFGILLLLFFLILLVQPGGVGRGGR